MDFRGKAAKVHKITDIPEAGFLNGAELLSAPTDILISDSALGEIWKLNVKTGKYSVVIDDPLMKKANPPSTFLPGVNGIRLFPPSSTQGPNHKKQTLYFANLDAGFFASLPISTHGTALAPAKKIAAPILANSAYDDFALDKKGNAWITTGIGNGINLLDPNTGKQKIAAGNLNSTEIAGPTSAAFGRTAKDRDILYVVTGGAQAGPVNGTIIVGAQVVAVDTRGVRL